ncbi:MAG: hypothetical protein O3A95_07830 [Planctomycetota bacterium]|nr:hypothetical protein [Planctomycetota bacterium]
MNTLHFTPDHAAPESPLSASGEKVFYLDPETPVAEAAEAFLDAWLARPVISMILVPESQHAAFLAALRPRIAKLPAAENSFKQELAAAIQCISDAGATLIVGGQDLRPALATNLILNHRLLASLGQAVPLVMVGTHEENVASQELLRDFCCNLLGNREEKNFPNC